MSDFVQTGVLAGNMKVRRTISLDKQDLEALKPFLDSTDNNLSKALRQLIEEYKQKTDMNRITGDRQKVFMLRNQIIENRIAELIPVPLVKWLAKKCPWVPPLGTFRFVTEKYAKLLGVENFSLNDYIKMADINSEIFGLQLKQNIKLSPDSGNISISFEAEDADYLKFAVMNFSCMFAHSPFKLKTKKVIESPNLIIVDYEQCSDEEEAYRSVIDNLGHDQLFFDEIQSKTQFWKNVFNILKNDHYEDLIISRDIFIQILKSHEFSNQVNSLISSIYGVSVENINYQDIVRFIGEILGTNGLIYRIEHDDNEIKVYHKFDERKIIRIINKTIINLLGISGQHFVPRKESKMTILSRE